MSWPCVGLRPSGRPGPRAGGRRTPRRSHNQRSLPSGLCNRTRPGRSMRPLRMGRASGSFRLTSRVALAGVCPRSRVRVCSAIRRVRLTVRASSSRACRNCPRVRPSLTRRNARWWLNLQAHPDSRVDLIKGSCAVRGRVAEGEERSRLWARWCDIDRQLAAYAALRSSETAVIWNRGRCPPDDGSPRPPRAGVPCGGVSRRQESCIRRGAACPKNGVSPLRRSSLPAGDRHAAQSPRERPTLPRCGSGCPSVGRVAGDMGAALVNCLVRSHRPQLRLLCREGLRDAAVLAH